MQLGAFAEKRSIKRRVSCGFGQETTTTEHRDQHRGNQQHWQRKRSVKEALLLFAIQRHWTTGRYHRQEAVVVSPATEIDKGTLVPLCFQNILLTISSPSFFPSCHSQQQPFLFIKSYRRLLLYHLWTLPIAVHLVHLHPLLSDRPFSHDVSVPPINPPLLLHSCPFVLAKQKTTPLLTLSQRTKNSRLPKHHPFQSVQRPNQFIGIGPSKIANPGHRCKDLLLLVLSIPPPPRGPNPSSTGPTVSLASSFPDLRSTSLDLASVTSVQPT